MVKNIARTMICLVFVLLYFIYDRLENPMYMYLKEALINSMCHKTIAIIVYRIKLFRNISCHVSLSLQIYIIISQNKHQNRSKCKICVCKRWDSTSCQNLNCQFRSSAGSWQQRSLTLRMLLLVCKYNSCI